MKKKIAAVVITSVLFSGTVSASSINGEFKGNSIVKVKSNGQALGVEDTPAIIYEGRTMVPIYMLRKLGLDIIWNDEDSSVDVKLPASNIVNVREMAKKYKSSGVNYISTSSDGSDYISIVFMLEKTMNEFFNDAKLFGELLVESANSNATFTVVESKDGQEFSVLTKAIRDMMSNKITQADLDKYYNLNGKPMNQTQPSSNSQPPSTYVQPATTTIESKIDGDFEGFEDGKIFKLQNGQIWEQADYTYKYVYKFSPGVLIYKDGTDYKMSVDGVDKKVKVKRLK